MSAVLVIGLCGCQKKAQETLKSVDLRYRCEDSYNLPASNAQPFTIVVTSSMDWTVKSQHPDWCIIDEEEGAASDPELVLTGKGTKTTIHVQYYDNHDLDDRTDLIDIKSDYWLGKTVKVVQKGIAYLTIPEDQLQVNVVKAGGDYSVKISSNQNWSAKVTDGDWISIKEGDKGNGDGEVVVTAQDNPREMRYATVKVYDRHDVEMYTINYTQDGVQLEPAAVEVRAGYDQSAASIKVVANSKWTATKDNDADDWYTIENPANDGTATLNITLKVNDNTAIRTGHIILKSVAANPGDFVAEKVIAIKQAYKIEPVRIYMDNDEMGKWKSDKTYTPVWTKGVGTLFPAYARLNNGDMPFGSYKFRWSGITASANVRHWFCYGDGQEIKFNLNATDKAVKFSFNASSSGVSGKPDMVSSVEGMDPALPHEIAIKFDPSGAEYCHVSFFLDGVEIASFDSSESVMHKVLWGASVNMYIGVDEVAAVDSAVLEWYEYTQPTNWDE